MPSLAALPIRSEEHTSELQSLRQLVCRLLLEKKIEKQEFNRRFFAARGIRHLNRAYRGRDKATDVLSFPWREAGEAPFFFNDTATTEIYPLSLHDALPI